jgi:hypothetical protein
MRDSTEFDTPSEFPSLIDDAAFLAELEQLELPSSLTAPGHARRAAMPAPVDPVVARDANRWHLHPPPGVETAPSFPEQPSGPAALVAILIGLSAGVAGSAMVFYERLTQIIALFTN